jgi:hypothetical protein
MELQLIRTYYPGGTNGRISKAGRRICDAIELPWLQNQPGLSCIPEGKYRVEMRYSPRFKTHMLLKGVPGRLLILIHPANNALKELRGCIAPVSKHTGEGKGSGSRIAFESLKTIIGDGLERGPVYLIIKS